MKALLRAELLKQSTTRTILGLLGAMIGLVLLVVLLHAVSLSTTDLATRSHQLRVLVEGGEVVGTLFAALLGAMSITGEIRHGTIRPTLLVTPQRGRVVTAKILVAAITGCVLGLIATAVSAVAGSTALTARGFTIELDAGNYVLLLAGGAAAAALWAVIGLGLGAIVRNQVAAIVGVSVWLLFIENVLLDSFPGASRYMPGALGQALTEQQSGTLHAPGLAALLLALYGTATVAVGWMGTAHRDFA